MGILGPRYPASQDRSEASRNPGYVYMICNVLFWRYAGAESTRLAASGYPSIMSSMAGEQAHPLTEKDEEFCAADALRRKIDNTPAEIMSSKQNPSHESHILGWR